MAGKHARIAQEASSDTDGEGSGQRPLPPPIKARKVAAIRKPETKQAEDKKAEEDISGSESDLVDTVDDEGDDEGERVSAGKQRKKQQKVPAAAPVAATTEPTLKASRSGSAKKTKREEEQELEETTATPEDDQNKLDLSNISPVRSRDPPNAPTKPRPSASAVGVKRGRPAASSKSGAKKKRTEKVLVFSEDKDDRLDQALERTGVKQVLLRQIERRHENRVRKKIRQEFASQIRGSLLQVVKDLK